MRGAVQLRKSLALVVGACRGAASRRPGWRGGVGEKQAENIWHSGRVGVSQI